MRYDYYFSMEDDIGFSPVLDQSKLVNNFNEFKELSLGMSQIDSGLKNVVLAQQSCQAFKGVQTNLEALYRNGDTMSSVEATAIVTECARIQRRMGMRHTSLSRYSLESRTDQTKTMVLENLSGFARYAKDKGTKILAKIVKFFKDLWTRFKNWWNKGKNTDEENKKKIDELKNVPLDDLDDWLPVSVARMVFVPILKTCDGEHVVETMRLIQNNSVIVLETLSKQNYEQMVEDARVSNFTEHQMQDKYQQEIQKLFNAAAWHQKAVGSSKYVYGLGTQGVRVNFSGAIPEIETVTYDEEWDEFRRRVGEDKIMTPDEASFEKLKEIIGRFSQINTKMSSYMDKIINSLNAALESGKDLPQHILINFILAQKSANFVINQYMLAKNASTIYLDALFAAARKTRS